MTKNVFYFMLKALFIFHIFSGYVEKRLDKKTKVNFKLFNVTDWTINNYNTYFAEYLKK